MEYLMRMVNNLRWFQPLGLKLLKDWANSKQRGHNTQDARISIHLLYQIAAHLAAFGEDWINLLHKRNRFEVESVMLELRNVEVQQQSHWDLRMSQASLKLRLWHKCDDHLGLCILNQQMQPTCKGCSLKIMTSGCKTMIQQSCTACK